MGVGGPDGLGPKEGVRTEAESRPQRGGCEWPDLTTCCTCGNLGASPWPPFLGSLEWAPQLGSPVLLTHSQSSRPGAVAALLLENSLTEDPKVSAIALRYSLGTGDSN